MVYFLVFHCGIGDGLWFVRRFCFGALMFCADARSSQFALFCAFLSNGDHGLS